MGFSCRAMNHFDGAVGNFLSDIDSKGDTDQVSVFEFDARPFVAVIPEELVRLGLQSSGNVFGSGLEFRVTHICGSNDDFKRRNLRWQPKAVFVIALLNGGSENSLDADAVAAHDRRNFFAVFVEHTGTHGFRVLIPELKNVANFDSSIHSQRGAAVGAWLAAGDSAKISVSSGLKIFLRSDVLDVVILFVSARYEIRAAFECFVNQQDWPLALQILGPCDSQWSQESGRGLE